MKQTILSIFLSTLLFFSNCKDLGEEIPPLESSIVITPWENLSPSQRTFTLNCATDEIYGCLNFRIINRFAVGSGTIEIWLDGIYKPEVCLTALGPATANIELGALAHGNYNVVISTATFSSSR